MTPSAIHQAIRLCKYPSEMTWICQSSAILPNGITDLLRLCASNKKLKDFAKQYHTDDIELRKTLLNFIDNVLLNDSNSEKKTLGTDEDSEISLCKLHYQLLIKTYHPDRNPSLNAALQTARITKAYQNIKRNEKRTDEFKNIRISKVHPHSFYRATVKAEQQLTNTRNASFITLALVVASIIWAVAYLFEPSEPELFSRNTKTIQEAIQSKPINDQFTMAKHSETTNPIVEQRQFQKLLAIIETAYESGNATKIQTLLDSPEIKQQSEKEVFKKLENLFKITSDRKMLLYDFKWKNISGKISGKGKFLSRYLLNGENQWLTREGIASILAKKSNDGLDVTSLKLDNKSINQ